MSHNYYTPLASKVNEVQKEKFQTESFKFLHLEGFKPTPNRIVRDVLNQAFDLSLSLEECMDIGRQILTVVSEA